MLLTSCHDWLDEKVYTQPTGEYIVSTPAGMASAVLAMYYKDREIFRNNDDAETILWMNMLVGDDITYCRAGEGIPQFGRYQDLLPTARSRPSSCAITALRTNAASHSCVSTSRRLLP